MIAAAFVGGASEDQDDFSAKQLTINMLPCWSLPVKYF